MLEAQNFLLSFPSPPPFLSAVTGCNGPPLLSLSGGQRLRSNEDSCHYSCSHGLHLPFIIKTILYGPSQTHPKITVVSFFITEKLWNKTTVWNCSLMHYFAMNQLQNTEYVQKPSQVDCSSTYVLYSVKVKMKKSLISGFPMGDMYCIMSPLQSRGPPPPPPNTPKQKKKKKKKKKKRIWKN